MLHPLSISPFLFFFPRPFLSLWFHPTFPPAVTPSQFPLVFHSSFYNPPLSAFVIRAVTEQCLQGLPRGLPVWHICFTTTHLTSPSSPSLYSGQITEEETENISLQTLHSHFMHPRSSTVKLSHPLLHSPSAGRPAGGRLIFLLKWSLVSLGIVVAQQSLVRPSDWNMII